MECSPLDRTRGWLRLVLDELTWQAHVQAAVGVVGVVVLDPCREVGQEGQGARARLAATTSSSALTAAYPPWDMSCLHLNSRLGDTPRWRATADTVMPGYMVSVTSASFCSAL